MFVYRFFLNFLRHNIITTSAHHIHTFTTMWRILYGIHPFSKNGYYLFLLSCVVCNLTILIVNLTILKLLTAVPPMTLPYTIGLFLVVNTGLGTLMNVCMKIQIYRSLAVGKSKELLFELRDLVWMNKSGDERLKLYFIGSSKIVSYRLQQRTTALFLAIFCWFWLNCFWLDFLLGWRNIRIDLKHV